ncbi:hypothetical protein ACFLT7_00660 [candidate division KSB1 bacterium]
MGQTLLHKALQSPTRTGLVALLMMGILFTDIKAQPLNGMLKGSMASAQDTNPTSQEAKLIGLLNTSLESLSDKARRGRRIGGYFMLGSGIGIGIGGAATLAIGDSDVTRIVGYSLLGGGILTSGLSLLPFKIPSESERIYEEFSKMLADKPDQVHQNFYYWDHRFEELAQKMRRGRLIGGISSILAGVTSYYFLVDGSGPVRFNAFIWPAFGGVTALLVKSDVERRYETYRRAKDDIIKYTGGSVINFGLAPLPQGGMLGALQVRF